MTELAEKKAHDDSTMGGMTTGGISVVTKSTAGGVSFIERLRKEHIRVEPYGEPTYWDERYENYRREHGQNFSFDWYVDPKKIAPILELHIGIENDRGKKIMIFGCGNSKLSEVLYDLGYRSITSVDTSTVVVSQMQYRYKNREGMDFMVADVMKMDMFPDRSFDIVIDKGCLDCIYCSYSSIDNAKLAYAEAWRLLKPGTGKYISISYGTTDSRMAHMRTNQWDVEVNPVPYSHGISMFLTTKFPESTKKGRLKAAMKWGAAMSRNTSKDKWKPQESTKHSTMTRHKDKVAMLALQGVKMLTAAEEKDLELDPSQGFHIEDVEKELAKGLKEGQELEKQIKEEHLEETTGIIEEKINDDIDDKTDPSSLASVLGKAVIGKAAASGNEAKFVSMLGGGKNKGGKRNSAIWNLAKKTIGDKKDVVKEGDNDDQIIDEEEWKELQD
ncbi:hypothetical protein TrCOL_g9132 [Triparma columacea]|uniref:Methyltransferase type 11 domain-containing protein n=1 Tax=Triparma columacea TaxID=722753 RepID=A0A9W7LAW8_9STRA|nr:hypothetical protein TrCOL_g9132 [Triparma columacea]